MTVNLYPQHIADPEFAAAILEAFEIPKPLPSGCLANISKMLTIVHLYFGGMLDRPLNLLKRSIDGHLTAKIVKKPSRHCMIG